MSTANSYREMALLHRLGCPSDARGASHKPPTVAIVSQKSSDSPSGSVVREYGLNSNPGHGSSDAQSVLSQEPPPYSEAGPSILSNPTPASRRVNSAPQPTKARSGSSQSEPRNLLDSPRPVPALHSSPPPPTHPSQMQLTRAQPRLQRRPDSTFSSPPRSPSQHPHLSPSMDSEPSPRIESQSCNFLSEHRRNASIKGVWNLDTGLPVPESLRPHVSEFYGFWNEMDKKSQKVREKERKKHEGCRWGRKKSNELYQPPKLANEGVMPHLMLASKNGSVQAEVNISSSDGVPRLVTVVAESNDGSVKLTINGPPDQSLRIFATSMDGSVRVRIPPTFEGAIWMTTDDGSINISDAIKPRLTNFSISNKTARCYLGDWQSAQFGHIKGAASSSSLESEDPFKTWTGPLVHIYAHDGSAHIAYTGEDTSITMGLKGRLERILISIAIQWIKRLVSQGWLGLPEVLDQRLIPGPIR
ncbi:hypothetical protein RHS04_01625 [Rhizoctonia solani]|uniref:DUF7330 domain-containing protein n=1 Tax=Rhizoctonia solani TaxID=456999 RepID=A0A8H7HCY1_9AGAM|nr:hypothetical protein RHS04_01625 [Rhizoctonia solani]